MTKVEILKKFTQYCKLNYISDNTINCYCSNARQFIYHKHPTVFRNLTIEYLKKYMLDIKKQYSISKYNQMGTVISIISKILHTPNKMKWFKPLTNIRKHKNILSHDQVINMVKNTNNLKHKTIIILLYSTGIRISELINIKRSDIDFVNKLMVISTSKNNSGGIVPLHDLTIKYIKAYIKTENSEYLIKGNGRTGKYSKSSIRNIIKRVDESAYPHLFRHSYLTEIVRNEDIYKAKLLARHKNIKSTEWYLHLDNSTIKNVYNPLDKIIKTNK